MRIGVPKEIVPDERRVALVPDAVKPLVNAGMEVLVEAGAGEGAFFLDRAYEGVGAALVDDARALFPRVDVVLKVQAPVLNPILGQHEVDLLKEGAALISFLEPRNHADVVGRLAQRKITTFSMDLIPRIARAQRMDALSSQSTVAGYKAVLMAAYSFGKFFPMLVTAAGTVPPARVLVLGSGPASDVNEFLTTYLSGKGISFDLIDFDQAAIDFSMKKNKKFNGQISYNRINALRYNSFRLYDLIWSAGLFDYFKDKHFTFLIRKYFNCLSEDGEMVISNFSTKNPTKRLMEVLSDWYLNLRTESDLFRIASDANIDKEMVSVEKEPLGINLFLKIRKN